MIRSSSVLRDVSAAVLALLVGLSAAVPAQAEEGEPTPGLCIINCDPGNQKPGPTGTPTPSPTPSAPVIEPPPPPPAPVAPAPVPTLAPEPSVSPAEETPSAAPSTTIPSPSSSAATASTESNWNKPITKAAKPTQAAAVSRNDGAGLFGGPGLLAIMGGVLLVGVAGLAFAWWSRNRLASH
ncbi:outer membrane biosynthesis protein TonB [Arthrobacter sp. UYNi723]